MTTQNRVPQSGWLPQASGEFDAPPAAAAQPPVPGAGSTGEHSSAPGLLKSERGLFTVDDVADALRISVRTLRRATTCGTLPCHRLGRAIRYTRNDIDVYLQRVADSGVA